MKLKKYIEVDENSDIAYHNYWYTMKEILRGKMIALRLFDKRKFQLNNLKLHLKA